MVETRHLHNRSVEIHLPAVHPPRLHIHHLFPIDLTIGLRKTRASRWAGPHIICQSDRMRSRPDQDLLIVNLITAHLTVDTIADSSLLATMGASIVLWIIATAPSLTEELPREVP